MNTDILKTNLQSLGSRDPELRDAIKDFRPSGNFKSVPSRSGVPTLVQQWPNGSTRALHSLYDPRREAARLVETCHPESHSNFVVLGLGLGFHVLELVRRLPATARIYILEKNPEFLYWALSLQDFRPVLTHPGSRFLLDWDSQELENFLEEVRLDIAIQGYVPIYLKSVLDTQRTEYTRVLQLLTRKVRESEVELRTQSAFSRRFYENIADNLDHILSSPGVDTLKNHFSGIPALLVSAGPSLDKNIALLKSARRNVLVIAVATALKPLLQAGVEPDFVVAIDPDEQTLNAFDLDTLPSGIGLVYEPSVPRVIPDHFTSRAIMFDSGVALAQWIGRHAGKKGSLGKTLTVAHTAFLFARHLGCSPLLFVGQDLAFDEHRLHCSGTFYNQVHEDRVTTLQTRDRLEKRNFCRYGEALAFGEDLFGRTASTTLALETYKNGFAGALKETPEVFNATEGGIPIPGVRNLSLKEALNLCCRNGADPRVLKNPLRSLRPEWPPSFPSRLTGQSRRFEHLAQTLRTLSRKTEVSIPGNPELKRDFVREMEAVYRTLLDDPESLKLLQGFSYREFLEWNQASGAIQRTQSRLTGEEILEAKVERDRKFLPPLLESAEALSRIFSRMARTLDREGLKP